VGRRAAALAREGRHVLVLTHRRRHTVELAEAVRAAGVSSCGTYVGGDKQAPDTRVIVATYALTSEGFDVPRLNALVLATPASDVEQSCGRVMRGQAGGALILDVADQWGVCFSQLVKRRAFYRRSGFTLRQALLDAAAAEGCEKLLNEEEADSEGRATQSAFAFLDDETDGRSSAGRTTAMAACREESPASDL
jgi:hypothetical protein